LRTDRHKTKITLAPNTVCRVGQFKTRYVLITRAKYKMLSNFS